MKGQYHRVRKNKQWPFVWAHFLSSKVIPHKLFPLAFPSDLNLSKSRGTGEIPLLSLNSMWTQMCCSSHRSEVFDLSMWRTETESQEFEMEIEDSVTSDNSSGCFFNSLIKAVILEWKPMLCRVLCVQFLPHHISTNTQLYYTNPT